jgi:tetratricopeptide (TPR) repeat protein
MPRWNSLVLALMLAASASQGQSREDEAARYSEEATAAMQAKNWPAAAKALRKLEQIAPQVAEVHANLGLVYYSQNRVAEAAAELERAIKINPQIPNAPVLLGLCKAELGQADEAIKLLAPEYTRTADPELRRMVGIQLMRAYSGAGQFARASETGEALLRDYPNDAEVLYQVAQLHADRSYEVMKQLQQTAPDSAWVHFASAQVHDSLKRYDAAEAEYRKAIEMKPDLPGAHYRLGRAMLSQSQSPEATKAAAEQFRMELKISPENPDAEYELGEIAREQGDLPGALEHLNRAVKYHPGFIEAQVAIGRTLLKQGKPKDAVDSLQAVLRADPDNKTAHYLLGTAYRAIGDDEASKREFEAYKRLQ